MIKIEAFNAQAWTLADTMNQFLTFLQSEAIQAEILEVKMTSKEHGYIVYKV